MSWFDGQHNAAFDRACQVGFLMTGDGARPLFRRYEAWCRERHRPLVWIRTHGRRADVSLRVDTRGGVLTPETIEEWTFLLDLMTPHGAVWPTPTGYTVSDVPLGQSEVIAFRLYEWAAEDSPCEAQTIV